MGVVTGLETIAGLAAAAAGTGLSLYGNAQTQNKMNNDVAAEVSQQNALSKRAQPIVASNIDASSAPKAKADISSNAAKTLAQYNTVEALPSSTGPASTPVSTLTENRVKGATDQSNQAAAKLMGYGGWQNDQSLRNQQAGNQLGLINTEARSDASLLPLRLQQDQSYGSGWNTAGSLLSALGSLAGVAGAVAPATGAATGAADAADAVSQGYSSPAFLNFAKNASVPMVGPPNLFDPYQLSLYNQY